MKDIDKKIFDAQARLVLAEEYGDNKIITKIREEIDELKKTKQKEK